MSRRPQQPWRETGDPMSPEAGDCGLWAHRGKIAEVPTMNMISAGALRSVSAAFSPPKAGPDDDGAGPCGPGVSSDVIGSD